MLTNDKLERKLSEGPIVAPVVKALTELEVYILQLMAEMQRHRETDFSTVFVRPMGIYQVLQSFSASTSVLFPCKKDGVTQVSNLLGR